MMEFGAVKYWLAVIIAFALIVGLSWCARAQEAQVGPKWEPVRVEVTMHRVHHVHRHKRHRRHDAAKAKRLIPGTVSYLWATDPLYREFVSWCLIEANACILPFHERN